MLLTFLPHLRMMFGSVGGGGCSRPLPRCLIGSGRSGRGLIVRDVSVPAWALRLTGLIKMWRAEARACCQCEACFILERQRGPWKVSCDSALPVRADAAMARGVDLRHLRHFGLLCDRA